MIALNRFRQPVSWVSEGWIRLVWSRPSLQAHAGTAGEQGNHGSTKFLVARGSDAG
jgi:hypothetical protein